MVSRLLLVAAAVLITAALAPGLAFAHADPTSSTPANGASVDPGLTQVVINFSEEISVDQSNAQLESTTGAIAGVQSSVDRANRKVLTIQTPALAPGKYTVKWHAVTEDDNGITDGTIGFTVSGAASATPATTSSTSGSTTTTTTATGGDANSTSLPATGSAGSGGFSLILCLAALGALAGGFWLKRRARPTG